MISQFLSRFFKHLDSTLLACLLFALFVGLMVLYSASGQNLSRINAQLINIAVALSVMWATANIPPQHI